jgi:hypothetical protein
MFQKPLVADTLKVDSNEKSGGAEGDTIQLQYGIVAIEGYWQYERVILC